MKKQTLERILAAINECDEARDGDWMDVDGHLLPKWLKDDLVFSCERRKTNLLDQLREAGLDLEV